MNGHIKNSQWSMEFSPRTRRLNVGSGDRGGNRAGDMKQSYPSGVAVSDPWCFLGGKLHHEIKILQEFDDNQI